MNNGTLQYHLVWCTKYRRKVLTDGIGCKTKEIIEEVCSKNGWQVLELEVMPEHIHIFVKANPKISVHRIVSQLKGNTSFILRREFPELTHRIPCLWTRSYYADSIGNASKEIIQKYIQNQKKELRPSQH